MKRLLKVSVTAIALAWIPIGTPAFAAGPDGGTTSIIVKIDAEPHPHMCAPYADVKDIVDGRHQTIINLTGEQFQFLRGVFTLNPNTAAGLPYGDRAAWVFRGDGTARVLFIDGDKACDAFDIPSELVDMATDVARGKINHAPPPDLGPPT